MPWLPMAKVGRLIYAARRSARKWPPPMPLAWPIGWSGPIGGNGSLPLILSCRQALQVLAITHGASTRQVLGVSPGERATTTLRNLLALACYRLEAKRNREAGDRAWRYRVVAEPLFRTGSNCSIIGIQLTATRCNIFLAISNKHRPNSKTHVKIYQE